MSNRVLTNTQVSLVCDDYARGDSGLTLARRYFVSACTIYTWLHRRGIPLRKRGRPRALTAAQARDVKRAWHAGAKVSALAQHYGVDRHTVSRYIHKK